MSASQETINLLVAFIGNVLLLLRGKNAERLFSPSPPPPRRRRKPDDKDDENVVVKVVVVVVIAS